jgi:RNA polymerase sigma-70 factor (ECF subfamily)
MSEHDTDSILICRAQQGDRRSFDALAGRYQNRLTRLIARMLQDTDEVEDVMQDVFIKAWRALPGFRAESAFYTWLYRIGVNTAKTHLAKRRHRLSGVSGMDVMDIGCAIHDESLRDTNTPECVLMSRQIGATVHLALESLPKDLCQAIVLREIEGLSYDEIASAMNCPVGTVRSRIFRAREVVADKLRPLLDVAPNRRW